MHDHVIDVHPSLRFEDLYREHGAHLWRSVLLYSGDPEIASDAVAEAFAQAIRRGDEVHNPLAWVTRAPSGSPQGSSRSGAYSLVEFADGAVWQMTCGHGSDRFETKDLCAMSAARIDATTHTVTTLPLLTEHVEVSSEGTFVRDAKGPPLGVEGGTLWYTVVDIDAVVYDPDVGSHVVTADSRFTDSRVIAVDTAGGAVRSVPIGDAAVDDLALRPMRCGCSPPPCG